MKEGTMLELFSSIRVACQRVQIGWCWWDEWLNTAKKTVVLQGKGNKARVQNACKRNNDQFSLFCGKHGLWQFKNKNKIKTENAW